MVTSMQAVRALQPGDPSALQIQRVELPVLEPGTVLVRVTAAGVNRSDALACRGVIPGRFPRTLGRDFAGVVVAGSEELAGRRVWGSGGGDLGFAIDGTHAGYVAVPEHGVSPLPPTLGDVEAAGSALAYFTAYSALTRATGGQRADAALPVSPGDTVIITGAAGGVGGAAAAIAHWRGARVVGVVRNSEQAGNVCGSTAAAHFDALVPSDSDDLPERLLSAARGATAAVDVLGGPMVAAIIPALAVSGGICVLGGSPTQARTTFDTLHFYRQELRLVGLHTGRLTCRDSARILHSLAPGFESGQLPPVPVFDVYDLEEAPTAYAQVERGVAGRPVLVP